MKSFLPLIFIATAIGLFYLYIDPTYTAIGDLSNKKSQYVAAISEAKDLSSRRDELLTKYNDLPKDQMTKLASLLPDSLNSPKLIADIDSIAGKYGISVKAFSVTEESSDKAQAVADSSVVPKAYLTSTISFSFSATYDNLILFLRDLEKSLELIDVKSIRFQSDQVKGDKPSGLHDYKVSFQTYRLK